MCRKCFSKQLASSRKWITTKLNWKFYKVSYKSIGTASLKPCHLRNNHVTIYSFDADSKMPLFDVQMCLNRCCRIMAAVARSTAIMSTSVFEICEKLLIETIERRTKKHFFWFLDSFSMSIQPKGILSAVLFPKLDASKTSNLYSEGIRLLIHESGSFASTFSFEKIISHRVETLVRLKSIKTTCHPQVSQGSIEARECLYETEKSLK